MSKRKNAGAKSSNTSGPGPSAPTTKNVVPDTELDPSVYRLPKPKQHRGPSTSRVVPGTGAQRMPGRRKRYYAA